MSPREKHFIKDWWKAIAIGFSLQILAGLVIGVGSIRIGLRQINENKDNIEILGESTKQSTFELQMNQVYIASEEDLSLPYTHTNIK